MQKSPTNGLEWEAQVEQALRDADIVYAREKVVGDARPDFLVTTDSGDLIVVEAKSWEPSPESAVRALNQAQRYKELSNAAASIVVTPAVLHTMTSAAVAVTPLSELVGTIAALAANLSQHKKPSRPVVVQPAPKKKVFASMPFATQFDDTFLVAIEPASLANGAVAERVDHSGTAGPVMPQIKAMIKAARVIVADLSDSRPNVLHETGFAEALQKPIIQICSTPTSSLPFNVRNNQTIQYSIGQTSKLKKSLELEIKKYV